MLFTVEINDDISADLGVLAEAMGMQIPAMLEYCLDMGISVATVAELGKRKQEKKERTKERKEQKKIYINIYTSLEGGSGETSLAYPKVDEKEKRRTVIPKEWVAAADVGELPYPEKADLLRLAKNHNFHPPAAKDMFIAFANHHAAKGTKYKSWSRTWTQWVLHQKKFNPDMMGKRSDSVLRSYKPKKMLEGMFDANGK